MKPYKKEAASDAANIRSGRTENLNNVSILSLNEFWKIVKSHTSGKEVSL